MRILMITAAVLALGACNRGGNNASANAAAGNKAAPAANSAAPAANTGNATAAAPAAPAAAGGMPEGFPPENPTERALGCAAYLALAREAGATPAGRDAPIMEQAEGQWVASLTADGRVTEEQVEGQLAPIRQGLAAGPAAQRDTAAAWCVENAPEVDPEG
jgi:hypothetical protein